MSKDTPLARLRHHVTGAIERGEAQAIVEQVADERTRVKIIECGCCGGMHRLAYHGDCRNDNERFFDPQDAEARLGVPVMEVYEEEEAWIYENEANARLIAAAPETAAQRDALLIVRDQLTEAYAQCQAQRDELLAALRDMVTEFSGPFKVRNDYSKMVARVCAEKAIARAEGRAL